jgi:hypothetical protein
VDGGFLREYGIDFSEEGLDAGLSSHGAVVVGDPSMVASRFGSMLSSVSGLEEDLELSTSLLTMSLDQDIPIDAMALSAGDRSILARPMAEDAMAALDDDGSILDPVSHSSIYGIDHSEGSPVNPRRGGRRRRPTEAALVSAEQNPSPSGPLSNAYAGFAGGAEFGIEPTGGEGGYRRSPTAGSASLRNSGLGPRPFLLATAGPMAPGLSAGGPSPTRGTPLGSRRLNHSTDSLGALDAYGALEPGSNDLCSSADLSDLGSGLWSSLGTVSSVSPSNALFSGLDEPPMGAPVSNS